MRVAVVSLETVRHRDAETTRRIRTVCDLLAAAGHDVHVFCARFWPGEESRLERDDLTYHGVVDDPDAGRSFLLRLPVALSRASPDVVHVDADVPKQVLAAGTGARLARAPLVLEWYGDEGVDDGRLSRLAARRADRIVVPSELVATWVRELGADGDVVDAVPNPIDVDRIRNVEPGESVDVVYARRLDAAANLESLLLSLAELRGRDWRVAVLGDGPERGTYERLARDLRIEDRIDFRGECDREERIAAYRGAHVFAQTAEHCVFPTELLRALAAGCVGIVEYHANSSAHELVEGWDRGIRTTNDRELSDAIVAAGDLERRAFDETFADYDREAVLERYLEGYRRAREDRGL